MGGRLLLLTQINFSHQQAVQGQQDGGKKFKQHHPPTQRSRWLQGIQLRQITVGGGGRHSIFGMLLSFVTTDSLEFTIFIFIFFSRVLVTEVICWLEKKKNSFSVFLSVSVSLSLVYESFCCCKFCICLTEIVCVFIFLEMIKIFLV